MGVIYVFVVGNGGFFEDSCVYNGYVNNIYIIVIIGLNKDGLRLIYVEDCFGIMVLVYSRDILRGYGEVVSKIVSLWKVF